jgi:hypothetical protein
MSNAYEVAGRVRKAMALVGHQRAGYAEAPADRRPKSLANALEAASDEDWRQIARSAGVREPSTETRRVVISVLRDSERNPDPFAGLERAS